MKTISVIEDNVELAHALKSNLVLEGYRVTLCHDGAKALTHIITNKPDLLILDMMLPHVDGFEIIEQMQQHKLLISTLCLTARSTELDKVRALRSGADDYLTKPFGLMELLARCEVLLRRNQTNQISHCDSKIYGHLRINALTKNVKINNKDIDLSPKEFQLLLYLCENQDRALTRIELMEQVWGHQAAINSRTVDTHIAELRKKCLLGQNGETCIKTISKTGYQLINNNELHSDL